MESAQEIIQQQAEEALQRLNAQEAVSADEVARSALQQVVYWEKPLAGDEKLLFVRLLSPVVMREEVFLGNILFNDFLSKAFVRAVEQTSSQAVLIANDLENYYFLVRTGTDLPTIAEALRFEVENSLKELFFGEPDPARGIYGSVETMLDFNKANVEPFPVFIMPEKYKADLEKAVRESLLRKIERSQMDRNPSSIMANLAFFYSRDGAEMQSPYLFLARLALKYGVLSFDDLCGALNLKPEDLASDEKKTKKAIEDALKKETFSGETLRDVFKKVVAELGAKVVAELGAKVEADPQSWLMPYISKKFLGLEPALLVPKILASTQIGYFTFAPQTFAPQTGGIITCRVCGLQIPEVEDKSILMGLSTHRFHNQAVKQENEESPKACLRCALFTYLMVKLLGSEAIGQPQVPKTYNLIFHYGKHTDDEVSTLAKQMDTVWERVSKHRQKSFEISEIREKISTLKDQLEKKQSNKKRQAELGAELDKQKTRLEEAQAAVAQVENDIFATCPWMRDVGESPAPPENPALDVLSNLSLSESKVERHVLGLGMGGYRMVLFILPQIRKPQDAKEHDYSQSRFSNSWLTISAFLSFLHHLCGCDGPFYYQSLPTLTPEAFQPGTFYIRNQAIRAEEVQQKYAVIYNLAWRLVPQRGPKGFVKKVMLAEKLLADPLGTFSAVLRDSPVFRQKKGVYKWLKTEYRQDWASRDFTEYVRFMQQLAKL